MKLMVGVESAQTAHTLFSHITTHCLAAQVRTSIQIIDSNKNVTPLFLHKLIRFVVQYKLAMIILILAQIEVEFARRHTSSLPFV